MSGRPAHEAVRSTAVRALFAWVIAALAVPLGGCGEDIEFAARDVGGDAVLDAADADDSIDVTLDTPRDIVAQDVADADLLGGEPDLPADEIDADGVDGPDGDADGGDADTADTGACSVDTDGDGEADCVDDDDDGDGLTDTEEAVLGTDPLDADSDRDGLTDFQEVNTDWPATEYVGEARVPSSVTVRSDPTVPTLLVEVDSLPGYLPDPEVLLLAVETFSDAGIDAYFWVDTESALTPSVPLTDDLEKQSVLLALDNAADDETFAHYVHVVFAEQGTGTNHGTTHYPEPNNPNEGDHGNDPDSRLAGSFVWGETVTDQWLDNQTELETLGITVEALMARSLGHELGHLLGCAHEGSANGGFDYGNVMVLNSNLGDPTTTPLRWETQFSAGHPRFSERAVGQMTLAFKASVESGASTIDRFFDMGTSDSDIAVRYVQVTHETVFDPDLARGFLEPLPTVSSVAGSNIGDARSLDYVRGDTAVTAKMRFAVSELGSGPVDVHFRMGATLDAGIQVRCEIVHPGRPTAFRSGPISAGGDSQETSPDLIVYPVVAMTALGYEHTQIVLDCLDTAGWDDAPLEFVWVKKRDT